VQQFSNGVFKSVQRPRWFFVMRPEVAMTHAAMPRRDRELTVWRMAAALEIDLAAAIKAGVLTRDAPLDLLQSITRRCAACHRADDCLALLMRSGDRLATPPDYCRVKNRLSALAADQGRADLAPARIRPRSNLAG
jgi:hypothetical protein